VALGVVAQVVIAQVTEHLVVVRLLSPHCQLQLALLTPLLLAQEVLVVQKRVVVVEAQSLEIMVQILCLAQLPLVAVVVEEFRQPHLLGGTVLLAAQVAAVQLTQQGLLVGLAVLEPLIKDMLAAMQ
jgi:hypothetical protein